ncbi:NAD(P)-dependent alcohol dehydrogenase [Streptomyces sp. NPDC058572]|uniref:NAD(P)-dependent alcohol dehydrogenase n=1 Tax=Streptomyces sp. NPDC058572 TaxID=3346546 RepID=UPI003649C007
MRRHSCRVRPRPRAVRRHQAGGAVVRAGCDDPGGRHRRTAGTSRSRAGPARAAGPDQRCLGWRGTFAVQIAAWLGARVTGVCSTRNVDLVRSIGADDVIDYTGQDFTTAEQRYDVILDLVGNHSLAALRRALAPTGTLVLSSGGGGRWLGPARRLASALVVAPFVRQRLRPFAATQDKDDLILLKELAESGAITPVIDRTYPLGHAVEAMQRLGEGHVAGKLVITMNDAQ